MGTQQLLISIALNATACAVALVAGVKVGSWALAASSLHLFLNVLMHIQNRGTGRNDYPGWSRSRLLGVSCTGLTIVVAAGYLAMLPLSIHHLAHAHTLSAPNAAIWSLPGLLTSLLFVRTDARDEPEEPVCRHGSIWAAGSACVPLVSALLVLATGQDQLDWMAATALVTLLMTRTFLMVRDVLR